MKRCITTILLVLSLEALVAAVADDVDIIRLPSEGKGLADQVMAAMKKGDEERPWKCCNMAICTMSIPPICRCLDKVEQCDSACKLCEAAESDPSRYTCQDWYRGDPGPRCTEDGNEDVVVVRGAAGGVAGEAIIMAATAKARDDDEERPWKGCDMAICTRSFPPICVCRDEVRQCASACKECEQVSSDPDRYRCHAGTEATPGPRAPSTSTARNKDAVASAAVTSSHVPS